VIEPQVAPVPALLGFPRLYVQLMQDVTDDPLAREESQGSSQTMQEWSSSRVVSISLTNNSI
jgi:hypothetical protein